MKHFFIKLLISLTVLYMSVFIAFDAFNIEQDYQSLICLLALILLKSIYGAVSQIMKN